MVRKNDPRYPSDGSGYGRSGFGRRSGRVVGTANEAVGGPFPQSCWLITALPVAEDGPAGAEVRTGPGTRGSRDSQSRDTPARADSTARNTCGEMSRSPS